MNTLLTRMGAAAFVLTMAIAPVFAVGVQPLRTELQVDPGGTATATLTVINSADRVERVAPEVVMYDRHDLLGFPQQADVAAGDDAHISNWITFSERELTMAPQEKREVQVTVRVPRDAEAGGRYGSVVYAPILDDQDGVVATQARVASLLLITVSGEELRTGEVQNFSLGTGDTLKSDMPLAFVVNFENTGTVHLKPTGSVTLMRDDGSQLTEIARYIDPDTNKEVIADSIPVNLSGGNVLPGSVRNFQAIWNNNIESGSFTARLSFMAGEEEVVRDLSFAFDDTIEVTDMSFVSGAEDGGNGFDVTLRNDGTVEQRLAGTVDIVNAFQFKLDEIEIPETLSYVAPGETATVTVPWNTEVVPEGQYEAVLQANLGVRNIAAEYRAQFGVGTNMIMLVVVGACTLVLVAGGVYVFARRRA